MAPWLVAASRPEGLTQALARMADLHGQGIAAEFCAVPCACQEDADRIAAERGCRGALWLPS